MDKHLFLDIETVPIVNDFDKLDVRLQELWQKKAVQLSRDENVNSAELFNDRAGIYSEFGKIIVIGLGYFHHTSKHDFEFRVKAICGDNELNILNEFKSLLDKSFGPDTILVAHNGKEFDFPYLARRMIINEISIPDVLNIGGKKPWEIQHKDTMEMWKFGDWKSYTSLDLLSAVFNIPSSKSDIDGSMVSEYYYEKNDLNSIAQYCIKDVIVCAQVFLRLNNQTIISEDKINILD